GIKISSSKDPYGVRRDANAVIKILTVLKFDFDLIGLIKKAAEHFVSSGDEQDILVKRVTELFLGRVENIFKDFLKFRYDIVNSILRNNNGTLNIYRMYLRAHGVAKVVQSDSIEHLAALHKRLKNIVKKSEHFFISEDQLVEDEEKILFDIFKETKAKIETSFMDGDYLQGCAQFLEMKPVIDSFFDKVLVMAEDQKVRQNRIALVQRLDEMLSRIADFSLIVDTK
ncbi:MAG: glycine--tRNA ligase subunit beta, partial [bacterium]|nr:glycine--tRNA ligase subunit beta [bacterium]